MAWQKLREGTGLPLEREFSIFGHPDCNSWTPLLVSRRTGRFIVFPPQDARTRRLYEQLLASVGGVSFVSDDARTTPFRLLGILCQHPLLIARLAAHIARLLVTGKIPAEFIGALAAGKAHTVGFGIHNFMDAAQVADAPNNATIQSRLDSCVFKGAVKNRQSGEWEAIPMCAMNQQRWSDVYEERLQDPALAREPQVNTSAAASRAEPVWNPCSGTWLAMPSAPSEAEAVAISIIVPCWREDAVSVPAAARWLRHPAVCEVVVALAGGKQPTEESLPGLRTIGCSRQGRGNQMNEAARVAAGNVFLFHHADTALTEAHLRSLQGRPGG